MITLETAFNLAGTRLDCPLHDCPLRLPPSPHQSYSFPALPLDETSRCEEVALKKFATLFLLIALSSLAWPQQMSHRLNNKDIIDMVALGLSDDVIIAKIR